MNDDAIQFANECLKQFEKLIKELHLLWVEPLKNKTDDNEIVCEWWGVRQRKLTIYFSSPNKIEYISVWGANINTEMNENVMHSVEEIIPLWYWLVYGRDVP